LSVVLIGIISCVWWSSYLWGLF